MSQDQRPTADDMVGQKLPYPAKQSDMAIAPASDLADYKAAGKLKGKAAIVTGADSGIGRAVAIA
ncbi:MAG: NAD(P)-dependent oxidoreductase, partial [Caulobacteraceae bacterium]